MTDLHTLRLGAEKVLTQATARLVAMQDRPLVATRKDLLDVVTDADLAAEKILLEGLRALTPGAAILSEEHGASDGSTAERWIIDPLDGTVNYASGLPMFSATIAYQENGETLLGLTHAPLANIFARYVRGEAPSAGTAGKAGYAGIATINDKPARPSPIASLADAVISVVLTAHFTEAEVRRAAQIIERLGRQCRGVRIVVSGAYEMSLVACGRLTGFVGIKADVVSHAAATPLVRAAGGRVTRLDGKDSDDADFEKIATNGLIHAALLACLKGV